MKIGEYKHRIEFLPLIETQDSIGDTFTTDGTSFKRWAKIVGGDGTTTTIQNQSTGQQNWIFKCRYFPFSQRYRIRYRDRIFVVQSFQDVDELGIELEIKVTEKRQALTLQMTGRSSSTMTCEGTLSLV